ncbi:MAG: hypothetical protein IT186_21645 [Acidobacteria bacterium]|nr:hypothetical protein [Acidobacteriota bacterium]
MRVCLVVCAPLVLALQLQAVQLADQLRSPSPEAREKAYAQLEAAGALDAVTIEAAVEAFGFADFGVGRIRPDGPDTRETPLTTIVARQGQRARQALLAGLNHKDWNVRRYSAFCLGVIGEAADFSALSRAFCAEVGRAQSSRFEAKGLRPRPLLSPLRAIAEALARINRQQSASFFLSLFLPRKEGFQNFSANYGLRVLFPAASVDVDLDSPSAYTADGQILWTAWMRSKGLIPR